MIRAFVIAIGALLVGGALYATIAISNGGWIIGLQAGTFGVLLLASILFERRYRPRKPPPEDSAAWVTTGERFADPTTGRIVAVRYNASTGERAYIDEKSEN